MRSKGCWRRTACGALLLSALAHPVDAASTDGTGRAVFPRALEVGGKPTELRLTARTLSFQPARDRGCPAGDCPELLSLSGAVRLVVGQLWIAADRAELLLEGGRLRRATAQGHVTVGFARGQGRATSAVLSVRPVQSLELSGGAELISKDLGLRLRGTRIALELASGKAVVHEAQVELRDVAASAAGGGR